ncbi:MAG: hypothetical protein PHY44_03830 [Lachnospiraceae bacterium]|nr:hypothetical protein [Lachnospiraceae bacterium]
MDYTKQIYVYKTNLSKGLDGKETYSLENIDRVIFNDVYTTNPQGWQYPPIIRHIYCGKINRADSELILEDIGEKDFLVKDINQESLYFFIDTIEEIKYDSLDVNTLYKYLKN